MATLFEPAAHAAVVAERQRVVPLPGRRAGPLLSAHSPLVRRALDLVAADPRERTFLWKASPHVWHRVRLVPLTGAVLVMERPWSLPYGMTSRELEVLTEIAAGSCNAQIARDLVVAPRTVATHVEHLLDKLGAHSRARCAAIAAAEGLILERP